MSGQAEGQASTRSTRKRTHRSARRTRSVSVRFDEDEYAALVVAAGREDLSPTAYVGAAAMAAARGTEAPGAPIREALIELNQARTGIVRVGVALNKLAAKVLAGGETTRGELVAAADVSARSVARVDGAVASVARRLA